MSSISQDFLTHHFNFPLFQYSLEVLVLSAKSFSTNYVLRIYRFEKGNPKSLVGVIEEVGVEGKKAFTNYDELWEILISSKGTKNLKRTEHKKYQGE